MGENVVELSRRRRVRGLAAWVSVVFGLHFHSGSPVAAAGLVLRCDCTLQLSTMGVLTRLSEGGGEAAGSAAGVVAGQALEWSRRRSRASAAAAAAAAAAAIKPNANGLFFLCHHNDVTPD